MTGHKTSYPGGKAGSGTYQRLINQIPPHDTFISAFLGQCAVMRLKVPASVNIGVDADPDVIRAWKASIALSTDVGRYRYQFIQADAILFLETEQHSFTGTEFVYLDPPYLPETLSHTQRYRYKFNRKQHESLLDLLKNLPCPVMISGYPSGLYSDRLRRWRTVQYPAMTRGGLRDEWAWCNYPEPMELHDYRYLGESFRDRERIKRKKDRWAARLKGMPALERQAVLWALKDCENEKK